MSLKGSYFAYWDYRVVRREIHNDDDTVDVMFGIHECFYEPLGWTPKPVSVHAESLEGLRDILNKMLTALEADVIEVEAE